MANATNDNRANAQTRSTGYPLLPAGIDSWGIKNIRLDPFKMPHRVYVGEDRAQSFTLDRAGAVIKRRVGNGLPVSMSLPAKAFKGIAARAIENADGSTCVSLYLLHNDRDLCVPLLVTDNLDDVAADWHAWARLMRLPMLILDQHEQPHAVRKQIGEIMVESPADRRKRYTAVKHRPRFLRRRKPGNVGIVERITAYEIIARN